VEFRGRVKPFHLLVVRSKGVVEAVEEGQEVP
jgi:hypothetical protein